MIHDAMAEPWELAKGNFSKRSQKERAVLSYAWLSRVCRVWATSKVRLCGEDRNDFECLTSLFAGVSRFIDFCIALFDLCFYVSNQGILRSPHDNL